MTDHPRRFPLPWSIDEAKESFCIRDSNGQALAYVYFEDEPGRRTAAGLLTRDETRRIAANMAKLGEAARAAAASGIAQPEEHRFCPSQPAWNCLLCNHAPRTGRQPANDSRAGRDAQAVGECRLRARRI
jgi:hypothetical protein